MTVPTVPSIQNLPAAIPAFNTSTVIIIVLVAAALYGLIAGKQRLRIFILSIYVGIVLAEQFASLVAPSMSSLGADQTSWLLLGTPIFVFGFFGVLHKKNHAKGSALANLIVGLLAGALIVAGAIQLLPPSGQTAATDGSFLALNLHQFYLYLLGGLPVVALLLGFMKSGEHAGH